MNIVERLQPAGFYDGGGCGISPDAQGIVSFKNWLPQERGAFVVSILRFANGVTPRQLDKTNKLVWAGLEAAEYFRLKPAHR